MKSSSSISLSRFADSVDPGPAEDASSLVMSSEPEPSRNFGAFYRSTLAPLRRYLARLLGNGPDAQDVAHDAYMRVFPTIAQDKAEHPEALLYVTARRLAINRIKRRSISPLVPEGASLETAASRTPGVAQQVIARQELQLLQDAIATLPDGCRSVLLLRKVELLSHREIADRLGIAVSTVEKQHARALRLLRAALPTDRGVSLGGMETNQQSPASTEGSS